MTQGSCSRIAARRSVLLGPVQLRCATVAVPPFLASGCSTSPYDGFAVAQCARLLPGYIVRAIKTGGPTPLPRGAPLPLPTLRW